MHFFLGNKTQFLCLRGHVCSIVMQNMFNKIWPVFRLNSVIQRNFFIFSSLLPFSSKDVSQKSQYYTYMFINDH